MKLQTLSVLLGVLPLSLGLFFTQSGQGSPFAPPAHSDIRLEWQPDTLTLIEPGALYGRMIRLKDKTLLCSYEKQGKSWVRRSTDNGKTWKSPVLVAQWEFGTAANPELLQLKNGRLFLFYNGRPRDGAHRFSIGAATSDDNGATWNPQPIIFEADTKGANGCWEPAAIQLPSGEVQLFFANEFPYQKSDEQEISLCRSLDKGKTWSKPEAVIFRAGHRDGMPVPLILKDNAGIAVAIEDNGLPTSPLLQPVITTTLLKDSWKGSPIGGDSPQRWSAVQPPLATNVYAGAPYLRQLPTGETVLSFHSTEGRKKPHMVVYIGDRHAKNFTNVSVPFDIAETEDGMWNALAIKDANTVTALSSTSIKGVRGLWAIDGKVVRARKEK